MKAIVQGRLGPARFVRLKEVEKPVPKDHEVLVRVMASSLNFADVFLMGGGPWFARLVTMFMKPGIKIPGTNMTGRVEAVGRLVTQFNVGDEVFCNLAKNGRGAFAEFVCAPENILALKPSNLTFEEAASLPESAGMAVQGLCDKGGIQPGMKVLIQGASGGIGTIAVQVAKAMGAEITGVCSGRNIELVRSLGADHVIDYTREDFTRGEKRYDLILGIKGYHPLRDYERALTPDGTYVMAGGSWRQIFEGGARASRERRSGEKKVMGVSFEPRQKDLIFIRELVEAGKVRPVIDRVYPLRELAKAIHYFNKGRTRGKVVIQIG